ncbi:MFS transporter [Clostridium grantii]|uniref:MFS transporter, PPP family, 3-phenylpropionic acid transporter n=1 Tax=Clostridium grantii DSM 8605 TaxID=1121316 RepID=A0A1M5VZF1_9CLOT|nr:MFS transporter [Clostridium grantii]SHH80303.1 MFS transporter, PPP family, 3-phenylpropionic acid transporter [Clostridium grantii DSM 8605]
MKKIFKSYYFSYFFAVGIILPLLPVYLNKELMISKPSVGIIMSFIPLISIVGQPIWGYISDYSQKFKLILLSIMIIAAFLAILLANINYVPVIVFMVFIFSFFYCGIVPLSDRFALEFAHTHNVNYGSMRLWGSIGFAVSTLVIGYVTDYFGLRIIFYLYSIIMLLCCLTVAKFPLGKVTKKSEKKSSFKSDLFKMLSMPQFIFLVLISMFSFSTLLANNSYLGLYMINNGTTLTIIGTLFFVSAISEVPFMLASKTIIEKVGVVNVLFISILATSLRWFLYFLEPNIFIIYGATLLQGVGFGLMQPCIMHYLKEIVPNTIVTTAITIISAIGFGFGNWFCSFIGGFILKTHSINFIYLLFFFFTLIALCLLIPLNTHFDPKIKSIDAKR